MMNLTFQTVRDPLASAAFFDEEQAEAHDRLESMSRVACALIFQSARDMVCSRRVLRSSQPRRPKNVRKAEQCIDEITKWANTVFPILYEGGMSLAGAVATINRYQDQRGVRRVEYHVVKQMLLTKPQRLAIVDGPAKFRRLTNDVLDELAGAVSDFKKSTRESQVSPAGPAMKLAV